MGAAPYFIQDGFRFRKDDGSESEATWYAILNVDVNDLDTDTNYRIRISVITTVSNGKDENITYQYCYNSGAWTNITTTSSYIKAIASGDAGFNDGDDTTQQITSGGFHGVDCCSEDGDCGGKSTDPLVNSHVETELCFQVVGADVSSDDTIDIRVLFDNALDEWTEIPRITITPPSVPPTITTPAASDVEEITATGNGNIDATGNETCDKRGIVYDISTHDNPGDVAPDVSGYSNYEEEANGFGTGPFTRSLSKLSPGTKHYARAYARNSVGYYGYGNEINFTTKPNPPTNLSAVLQ